MSPLRYQSRHQPVVETPDPRPARAMLKTRTINARTSRPRSWRRRSDQDFRLRGDALRARASDESRCCSRAARVGGGGGGGGGGGAAAGGVARCAEQGHG